MSDKYLIDKSSLTALGDIVRAYNETPDKEYSLAEITAQLKESSENFYNLFENGISEVKSETATELKSLAFCNQQYSSLGTDLLNINLPNVTQIGTKAFWQNSLGLVNLPKLEDLRDYAFSNCYVFRSIYFPSLKNIAKNAFDSGKSRPLIVDEPVLCLPAIETIQGEAFYKYSGVIILKSVPTLSAVPSTFRAYVYVPAEIYDEITGATNWSEISDNIYKLENYTDDSYMWEDLIAQGKLTEEEIRRDYYGEEI